MALTTYCAPDEVRAALGVNRVELADTVLGLPIYEIGLVRELNKLSASLPAAFYTVANIAENLRSATEAGLYACTRLFSAYAVARQVGVSLATFAPKDVGDGKATISRFAGQPYETTMNEVKAFLADARAQLVAALAAYEGGDVPAGAEPGTFFMASTRATDVVTG